MQHSSVCRRLSCLVLLAVSLHIRALNKREVDSKNIILFHVVTEDVWCPETLYGQSAYLPTGEAQAATDNLSESSGAISRIPTGKIVRSWKNKEREKGRGERMARIELPAKEKGLLIALAVSICPLWIVCLRMCSLCLFLRQ